MSGKCAKKQVSWEGEQPFKKSYTLEIELRLLCLLHEVCIVQSLRYDFYTVQSISA